jgi:type II secretory pathway pseudopilin PulG
MITSRSRRSESGVALLTATVIVLIVGGIAAAFLMLSFSQSSVIAKSSESEIALHIAEAGIDDSLNQLQAYADEWVKTSAVPDWTLPPWSGTKPDFAVYADPVPIVTGKVNRGSYSVSITNKPTAAPVGTPFTTAVTTPFATFIIISTGTKDKVVRNIEVVTKATDLGQLFPKGLFGDVEVDALGTFSSDGYDSAKGSYASQTKQTYTFPSGKTATYVNSTGSIGSNGNIITGGSAQIMGDANPGPGKTLTGGADVFGSTTPSPTTAPLTPVTYTVPPTALGYSWSSGDSALVGGAVGKPVSYHSSTGLNPTGKGKLTITGEVVLFIDAEFNMNNQQSIEMAPGAKLTIYQGPGANDLHINGQAFVGGGQAKDFQIFSASTGDIRFNGGSEVYAAVYAPNAFFTNNGGNQFYGAMVASKMKLSGTAYFHYDEDLAKMTSPKPQYTVLSWREILK